MVLGGACVRSPRTLRRMLPTAQKYVAVVAAEQSNLKNLKLDCADVPHDLPSHRLD